MSAPEPGTSTRSTRSARSAGAARPWAPALVRSRVPTTAETVTAILESRELYRVGELLPPRSDVGRPRVYPGWSVVLFGTLARHFRSAARAHAELHSQPLWNLARTQSQRAITELGLTGQVSQADSPPTWGAWVTARNDHLATDAGLAAVARIHLEEATTLAHQLGLGLPSGPGSWSHPDKSRTTYGDGTLVTPMYRPPRAVRETLPDGSVRIHYPDPDTGELLDSPPRRYDPDAAEHHGKAGPVHATNYVAWHVRGAGYYQRVILVIDHVDAPGHEADTAVRLLGDVRRALGEGIQAVVYDGAFRGVHIDHVMRHYGYVVICKPATGTSTDTTPLAVRIPARGSQPGTGDRTARSHPLGTWEHTPHGARCLHVLAAINGAVCEIALDERGDPALLAQLARRQVKRPRRSDGTYHFSVGYEVPCPHSPFWVWISPHGTAENRNSRAENVRIIAAADPDGQRLVGIRSDAESHHFHYKRTLLVGRAMSKGWRRGLLDQYCFALLNNALVAHRAHSVTPSAA